MFFAKGSEEREIFQLIQEVSENLKVDSYLVGGYVRDRILARQSKDIDVVCVGNGIELARGLAGRLRPIPNVTVYKRFGTAMLRHNGMEIEFVGARKESYRADSRKPSIEVGSLQDDQNRRDFTINALAVRLSARGFGEIIDPFGGLHDLEEKIIRTPRDPIKTFADDPLRMMRAIRFATQLDFWIEEGTLQAISDCRNRIKIVSQERITMELNKIITSFEPSRGFRLLEKTGLLELVMPDLARLKGVEVRKGIGHKDNFYHTLQVLDNVSYASEDLWLRWAALLHDIAKPPTKRFDNVAGWTFHGHEALGAAMVPRIFRKLRLPLDHKMKFVQKLVRLHLRPIGLAKDNITDSAVRRLLFDAGDDIEALLTLCEADITSKNDEKVARYLSNYKILREKLRQVEAKDQLRNWEPPISGEVIMDTFKIKPCKKVGIIKSAIREAILEGEIPNEYEPAYKFMIEKGLSIGLKAPE
ncbi:MAG: CCA tRNA nucleotidyltransferase [Saprospiraceae bacterium]|nr:CCA tRNA nucleotidyltransferase [Saprospiraceae bacterium]